jgi:hypothetical protein
MRISIPTTDKTRNWPAYTEALKCRGSLTIWFDPEMIWDAAPTGGRGRQQSYSDAAIQTCLSMNVLFGMALRQTTGFVESLLRLVDLDWKVSHFKTLRRPFRRDRPHRRKDRPRQDGPCLLGRPARRAAHWAGRLQGRTELGRHGAAGQVAGIGHQAFFEARRRRHVLDPVGRPRSARLLLTAHCRRRAKRPHGNVQHRRR